MTAQQQTTIAPEKQTAKRLGHAGARSIGVQRSLHWQSQQKNNKVLPDSKRRYYAAPKKGVMRLATIDRQDPKRILEVPTFPDLVFGEKEYSLLMEGGRKFDLTVGDTLLAWSESRGRASEALRDAIKDAPPNRWADANEKAPGNEVEKAVRFFKSKVPKE